MATVTIEFTKEELWELMNNFSMSYLPEEPGNELAVRVGEKLSDAYNNFQGE